MDITRMAKMAQDFVASTSMIVRNRTINIMDTNGIIIASSDPKRIGTFHQGALEVVASRKSVQIHSSDLHHYQGAFEGCNMPIYYKSKIVGVVGINGEPEDVTDTANLLKVYVTQFFEQYALDLRKQSEAQVRKQIMNMYFSPYDISKDDLMRLEDVLSVHLKLPCKIFIIDFNTDKSKLKKIAQFDRLSDILVTNRFINSQTDIYGIKNNRFIIIHSCSKSRISEEKYINKLYKICSSELETEPEFVVGIPCNEINEIALSYMNARFFCRNKSGIYLLDKPINKERFLLLYLANNKGKPFAKEYYQKIIEGLGFSGLESAMLTIEAYYGFGRSVTKAAAKLCIHKNTLLYRLNRILSVTNLENEGIFTQELLLKLVLEYYKYTKEEQS